MRTLRLLATTLAGLVAALATAAVPPIRQSELDNSPQLTGTVTAITWQSVTHPGNPKCAIERRATLTLQQEAGSVELKGTWIELTCDNGWIGAGGVQGLTAVQVGDRIRVYHRGPAGGPFEIRPPNGLQRLAP